MFAPGAGADSRSMQSKKLTAADSYDTWDPGWEERLSAHVGSLGFGGVWAYVRQHPGRSYLELAEALAESGGFGVAPIQVERLQVRDTPAADLGASVRDSLLRHLRTAFRALAWHQGPYWESRAIGALASWTTMWSARVDLGRLKPRLFDADPPPGWLPADARDPFLLAVVPEGETLT